MIPSPSQRHGSRYALPQSTNDTKHSVDRPATSHNDELHAGEIKPPPFVPSRYTTQYASLHYATELLRSLHRVIGHYVLRPLRFRYAPPSGEMSWLGYGREAPRWSFPRLMLHCSIARKTLAPKQASIGLACSRPSLAIPPTESCL